MTSYYCHECHRRVTVNNALQCNNCRGEFVEEVEENEEQGNTSDEEGGPQGFFVRQNADGNGGTIVFEGVNPLLALLTGGRPIAIPVGPSRAQPSQPRRPVSSTSGSPSGSGSGSQHQRDAPNDRGRPNEFGQFLGQLIANLAQGASNGQGTRLTFQFGDRGGIFQAMHGHPSDYAWGEGGIDTIVTQLLNQFEGNQIERVSDEDLARLPMADVTEKQIENGTQCTTCMETFTKGEKVAKLDCQHIFHRVCIVPWLERHNTCPICRQAVDPTGWGPELRITDIDELD